MQSKEENGLIVARLFPGEDLFQSLREICRKYGIETVFFVSAIGQLKQFTLGYFDGKNYLNQDFADTCELLSISGMISLSPEENDYKFHMHVVVSDKEKKAFGGHLFKGIVEGTCELALLKTQIKAKRKKDEPSGLMGLYLD